MLNIYIGIENIPKDKNLIFDVEKAFPSVNMVESDFKKLVIKDIEKGSYFDSTSFIDRFNKNLYYTNMSTGSKALILLEDSSENEVVNFDECGENGIAYISLLDNKSVYFTSRDLDIPWIKDIPLMVNGEYYKSISWWNACRG